MAFVKPKCNCPDAIHQIGRDPGAQSLSDQIGGNWVTGFTGVREIGGYCIHELAVLRIRKEVDAAFPSGLPKDMRSPLPPKFRQDRVVYKLQNPSTLGDDFSI